MRAHIDLSITLSDVKSYFEKRCRHPASRTGHILPNNHDDGGIMLEEPHQQL